MMDLMGLFVELMTDIITLVTKPFSLIKVLFLLGAKLVLVVTLTWLQLMKAIINFHVDVCRIIMIWTVALVSLPFRILNALQKERLLEFHLQEMKIELQSLIWEKEELDVQLQIAIKDRRIMETILAEIEEDHDKAISKIDLLENELQVLKDENLRLNDVQGKEIWNFKSQEMGSKIAHDDDYSIPLVTDCALPPWKSCFNGSGVILQDLLLDGDAWEDKNEGKPSKPVLLKPGSKAARLNPFPPRMISSNLVANEALDRRRGVALSQCLFSTLLSLLVGMIIWEAEDPCMPLVVALFTVVGMSLKSVVQFFSTIRNRPASEAVALLSFNCFILGTLTFPALPTGVSMLAPPSLRLANWMVHWLGFSS